MRPLRFFLLLSTILLAACGNKGPLVQPDKTQPAQDSSKK